MLKRQTTDRLVELTKILVIRQPFEYSMAELKFFKKLGYWINFKNLEECKAPSKCSAYDGNGAEYCPVERGLVD